MPLRSNRLRFLAFALVAAGAACSAHMSGGALPSSGTFADTDGRATATAGPLVHAPCTIHDGFKSPLAGKLTVVSAFGELTSDKGLRSVTPGVGLATKVGQIVHAAQAGRAVYLLVRRGVQEVTVTATDGTKVQYEVLLDKNGNGKPFKPHHVKAFEPLGQSAATTLHFKITVPSAVAGAPATQLNPCGPADGATGTISLLPVDAATDAVFATFTLNGVLLPATAPGGLVATPATLSVTQVVPRSSYGFTTYQYGAVPGSYYVVLCGNVVFATGPNLRYAGPIPVPATTSAPFKLPALVFFRDPGAESALLTEPLPSAYGAPAQPCPGPAPPSTQYGNWVLNAIGQSVIGEWSGSTGTVAMTVTNPSVATVTPNPAPVDLTPPPYPPPPGTYFSITAAGIGTTSITNVNTVTGATPAAISVTVLATPTPAPAPTPLPNTLTTPTPVPTATPTPGATATPTPASNAQG
jgi:hypothetical protein